MSKLKSIKHFFTQQHKKNFKGEANSEQVSEILLTKKIQPIVRTSFWKKTFNKIVKFKKKSRVDCNYLNTVKIII